MSILCYHSIACGWEDPVSIEPADFERQCATLARRRRVVPLSVVTERLAATGQVPPNVTVLTFDDGFADFMEHAVPTLERYGLPATMFVVARSMLPGHLPVDWIRGLDPADAPPLLTVEQVQELHERGWDIASHSSRHADLPTLSEDEVRSDLTESRELLSDVLGDSVNVLAYPFGSHAAHVRRAAERSGYSCALALPEGKPEKPGPFAVPRVGIYRGNSQRAFRLKTTRPYQAIRTSAAFSHATGLASRMRSPQSG